MPRPHILLLENDPLTLTLLEQVLVGKGYLVTSSANFSPAVMNSIEKLDLAGAVLDLDLGPGPNGIDVGLHLQTLRPALPVVILTSYVDMNPFLGDRSFPKNMSYINKTQISHLTTFEVLLGNAIRGVTSGPSLQRATGVSGTALRVWAGIARGLTNEEIATEMGVGVKAIEKSVSKLLLELSISSTSGNPRVQLVRRYVEINGQLP